MACLYFTLRPDYCASASVIRGPKAQTHHVLSEQGSSHHDSPFLITHPVYHPREKCSQSAFRLFEEETDYLDPSRWFYYPPENVCSWRSPWKVNQRWEKILSCLFLSELHLQTAFRESLSLRTELNFPFQALILWRTKLFFLLILLPEINKMPTK